MKIRRAEPTRPEKIRRWFGARFFLTVGLLLTSAFAMGLLSGRTLPFGSAQPAGVVVPRTQLPTVEPLVLQQVDKATARQTNQAVPLTTAPVPPAPAFLFAGKGAELERAADCLAATIYYEAGAEPVAGQMAVVQVVLNRVRHPAYPKTVCGVVFQGHERSTGCQFSFTCDGSMARRPSEEAWQRFRGLARAMLQGLVYAPVGLATHYHTDWVLPAWSARLDKVRVEGTHLFFRYNGYWGTPAAYRGNATGTEPAFAALAALSPAHAGAALADTEVPTGEPVPAMDALAAQHLEHVSASLEDSGKEKSVFLIYVDPLLDSAQLTVLAERVCQARKACKVFAWADQALLPRGLPLEPAEQSSVAFRYIRPESGGPAMARWNCALFPRDKAQECI